MTKETQELMETLAKICEEVHQIKDILEIMVEEQDNE